MAVALRLIIRTGMDYKAFYKKVIKKAKKYVLLTKKQGNKNKNLLTKK